MSVLESKHVALSDRLEATKLMRKAESPKITPQTVRLAEQDHGQWREVGQRLARARRREKLDRAGLWPAPPDWCDDLLADEPGPLPLGDRAQGS
jgi:hypothetical protein